MPLVSLQELQSLQEHVQNIRNICIVAHVDHGKTTIADSLICTNGIISQRSAGKLRYMDNTAYEQQRGITVKSSSISLLYTSSSTSDTASSPSASSPSPLPSAVPTNYLINLIDSPGHMDFSGEVSSALRMTDGCFVVVDAIEGVCIQTRAVLRQAWNEKVKPTLVINKIDKLFSLLHLSPEEAYRQLLRVTEQVNEVMGSLWIEQTIGEADAAHMKQKEHDSIQEKKIIKKDVHDDIDVDDEDELSKSEFYEQPDDEELYFSPEKGNVVFASAFHGWGFSIDNFVEMYAKKLKLNRRILRKTLWGEYYFLPKTRKIVTKKPSSNAMTMFSSLVLANIHQIYQAILGNPEEMATAQAHKGYSPLSHRDLTKLEKVDKALNLNVPPRELKNEDVNAVISAFMGRWLPISTALLEMAVKVLPNPQEAQKTRIAKLWHPSMHDLSLQGKQLQMALKNSLSNADRSENAPVIAYVSKVFAVPNEQFARSTTIRLLPGHKTLIAMTRLFSGSIQVGDTVKILNARYNPAHPEKHCKVMKIPQLWTLMGPDLQPVKKVYAGCVFGIGGESLDLHQLLINQAEQNQTEQNQTQSTDTKEDLVTSNDELRSSSSSAAKSNTSQPIIISSEQRNEFVSNIIKTATLTNTDGCPAFGALTKHVNPIVRVAVEPESPADLQVLEQGMALLHQADAAVDVETQENGELIIGALGELHLQRCLEMLREDFAKVPIKVSKPVVSFRETVRPGLAIDPETKETVPTEIVVERTADRVVTLVVRAVSLPENITQWLETHTDETRVVQKMKQGINANQDMADNGVVLQEDVISNWAKDLKREFNNCSADWKAQTDFIWALGPHRIGPNILLNNIPKYSTSKYWKSLLTDDQKEAKMIKNPIEEAETELADMPISLDEKKELLTWFALLQQLDGAIRSGFQLATRAGPLCEEPIMGMAIQVLDVNFTLVPHPQEHSPSVPSGSFLLPEPLNEQSNSSSNHSSSNRSAPSSETISSVHDQLSTAPFGGFGQKIDDSNIDQLASLWTNVSSFTGNLISATRAAIRKSFLARPQRLYEAMYLAHVQVSAIHMGKAYAVLNRRRGDVLHDEVNESSGLTLVVAMVPAAEAFGFSEELVAKSGGAASAQLVFGKWQILDVDPNFIPTTEEELEEFGDNVGGIAPNLARKYVDGVRKRKGLAIHEKKVEGADKQRTLSKKK